MALALRQTQLGRLKCKAENSPLALLLTLGLALKSGDQAKVDEMAKALRDRHGIDIRTGRSMENGGVRD